MKKRDRLARREDVVRKKRIYEREEAAMQSFIDACRNAMPPDQWQRDYDEAVRHAGHTMHIVEYLVFSLAASALPITPDLRRSIDAVLEVCEIPRDRWAELSRLNYDKYWRSVYGYV